VLKTIFDRNEISRADVARLTGLTRTTVSQAVGTLLEQKLVKEIGQGASTGGKTPILLSVPSNARNLIGVDLGSNEFSGAIVNLRGEVRYRLSLPLDGRQGKDALELAYELIDALQVRVTSPLLGIGVGVPGVINPAKGSSVHWAVNLSWLDLPLRDLLQQRYQVPVYVANDSQVAALAESFFGKQRHTNLIVIKVGRGVGAAAEL
jgi:predicted NBD/HSP70 family sugar kinase